MLGVGIHTISSDAYHADRIDDDRPSLSASIANVLLEKSPRHAYRLHPRLGGGGEMREEKFDLGTATHAVFLEGLKGTRSVHVVEADSWRTQVAKDVRDKARKEGFTPLLTHEFARARGMAASLREQIAEHDAKPPLFTDGTAEVTVVWEDRGVLCRARLDWLRSDLRAVDDLKTTAASSNPWEWSRRTLWNIGGDVQVAMYLRGIRALTGETPKFRYVVVENTPPFAMSVVSLNAEAIALADQKINRALDTFRTCLDANDWPSYSRQVVVAEVRPWSEAQWLEREARDEEVEATA